MKSSFGKKIGLLLAIILLGLVLAFSTKSLVKNVFSVANNVNTKTVPKLLVLNDIRKYSSRMRLMVHKHVLADNPTELQQIERDYHYYIFSFETSLNTYLKRHADDTHEQKLILSMQNKLARLKPEMQAIILLSSHGEKIQSRDHLFTLTPEFDAISHTIDDIVSYISIKAKQDEERAKVIKAQADKIASIFVYILAAIISLPILVIFFQSFLAFFFKLGKKELRSQPHLKVGVLVPAHNESQNIVPTLKNLLPQLKPNDRLLVVADNCSDDTFEIAKSYGAEVIERVNNTLRGKGFALDFGLRHFADNPPDVVVIVDADCTFPNQDLQKLAALSFEKNLPVQCLYLMKNKIDSIVSVKNLISEFAWLFKNRIRPYGLAIIGMPCQLMGAGMVFPWRLAPEVDLASNSIVEDMKLGIKFAQNGTAPLYYDEVLVESYFPTTEKARESQSIRWEHGHLGMIITEFPRLMFNGLLKFDLKQIFLGLDLLVPPLSLLMVFVCALLVIAFIDFLSSGNLFLVDYSFLVFGLFAAAILMAWIKWARHILSFTQILFIPIYISKKLPNYFSFLFKRQKSWVRTDRE